MAKLCIKVEKQYTNGNWLCDPWLHIKLIVMFNPFKPVAAEMAQLFWLLPWGLLWKPVKKKSVPELN